jgi:Spy/CpxP family protein refolding chaperone
MNAKKYGKNLTSILLILAATTILPIVSHGQPPGYMMRHMDDESMERMMDDRGYGYGYRYGNRGHMGPMMGPMGHMMGNLYGLDLSDKQRDQVRDIQRNMRKQHWDLMEKMMETSDKLVDLYDVEKPDAEKIGKVYDEIYKIKRQMIQQHIEIRNKIYDILNKEQREKFRANDPFARRFGMMY